ncbi:MAG: sigma-54-dependent Fis family transcriptional regulator [Deltaproteobacteria bacterium]|nr:sigma-54-dependent Fis family transcriptional regulator [Deltaproteobacteria bacterium]
MNLRILVIDDEPHILELLAMRLSEWGHEVTAVSDGEQGLELLGSKPHDVVVTDLMMPGLSGVEVVKEVKQRFPGTEVLVITGFGTVGSAVEVMKAGAFDYLLKPLNFAHIKIILNKIEQSNALKSENERLSVQCEDLRQLVEDRYDFSGMIGHSPAMKAIFELVRTIGDVDSTVLITGETGAGKELLARTIHFNSIRKDGPFLALDCGAVPENLLESELFGHEKGAFTGAVGRKRGRFERAHGGTLFLDEIGNTTPTVQQKLLRVLQERAFERVGGEELLHVDVRVLAATNRNLEQDIEEERFRMDLFYRLNVIPLRLPPLRERKEDIPPLARHFLRKYAERFDRPAQSLSEDAVQQILSHSWPGNVRELENVIERAVILSKSPRITNVDLPISKTELPSPERLDTSKPLKSVKDEMVGKIEARYLKDVLAETSGNIQKTALRAGIDEKTLYTKMKIYHLTKEEFRR